MTDSVGLQFPVALKQLQVETETPGRGLPVFWWFERGGKFLRYETRDCPGGRFELRVVRPDGTEQVETFDDSSELAKRQRDVEQVLAADGWSGPHGWNL